MAKVLVSDSLAQQGLAILEAAEGIEVDYRPGLAPGDLIAAIADAEALVIRSGTKVTADVIAAGTKLRAIGRAGIGVDDGRGQVARREARPVIHLDALARLEDGEALLRERFGHENLGHDGLHRAPPSTRPYASRSLELGGLTPCPR